MRVVSRGGRTFYTHGRMLYPVYICTYTQVLEVAVSIESMHSYTSALEVYFIYNTHFIMYYIPCTLYKTSLKVWYITYKAHTMVMCIQ